jgi:drug/metabolite transporter (DMT)-like permease
MAATTTVVLLSIASGVFWGIGPIFSKVGMERGGDANRATMIVLVVGSSGFLAVSVLRDGSSVVLADVSPETLSVFALAGVLGTSFAWLLWFRGIDRIGASVSNIVFYTQPLFAAILAALVLGEELTVTIGAGVVFIVGGVVLLSSSSGDDVDSWSTAALLFPLGAAVFAAVGNVLNRYGFRSSTIGPVEAAAINLTSALPVLVGYALVYDRRSLVRFRRSDYHFVASGIANAVGVLMLFAALSRGPVVVVSPIVGSSPLFTAVFAYFVLGEVERVTTRTFVSAALTVTGVAVIALA